MAVTSFCFSSQNIEKAYVTQQQQQQTHKQANLKNGQKT